jgi:glycosyltransferase involved in cell wall biosynthesis
LGGTPVAGVETAIIPRTRKTDYLFRARRAVREVTAFRPDVIHVHSATGYGLWSLAARFRPTIVSVWGSDVISFPSNWPRRFLVRTVLQRATHITATSRFLAGKVTDILPGSRDRISIIPFGVNIPERVEPFPESGPVKLCFIKVHYPVYGLDILIRAMVEVVNAIPDIVLSIAGEGPMTENLKRMVTTLGLDDNIRFVGFVENRDIYSFIRQHHLMVMPSLMESFGVAVLEAGACGRASLASRVGGVPEVLLDGKTGVMVPAGDSHVLAETIISLANDREALRRMGLAAYKFVRENYAWDNSLDLMTSLYDRVIKETC